MIAGIEMPTAIDISSVVGLIAVGLFTAQILMGLLLSVGYNPIRQWPRQRWFKLFTFHNWLGYIGLATAFTHPLILLASSDAGFRLFDIAVPPRPAMNSRRRIHISSYAALWTTYRGRGVFAGFENLPSFFCGAMGGLCPTCRSAGCS